MARQVGLQQQRFRLLGGHEPDRHPDHGGRPRAASATRSSRASSAVGALPIATTAPSSRSARARIPAADRVIPCCRRHLADARCAGSPRSARHLSAANLGREIAGRDHPTSTIRSAPPPVNAATAAISDLLPDCDLLAESKGHQRRRPAGPPDPASGSFGGSRSARRSSMRRDSAPRSRPASVRTGEAAVPGRDRPESQEPPPPTAARRTLGIHERRGPSASPDPRVADIIPRAAGEGSREHDPLSRARERWGRGLPFRPSARCDRALSTGLARSVGPVPGSLARWTWMYDARTLPADVPFHPAAPVRGFVGGLSG